MPIANKFYDRKTLPICIGAFDGKHTMIRKLKEFESQIFWTRTFSQQSSWLWQMHTVF
jgi:hypothetical protein